MSTNDQTTSKCEYIKTKLDDYVDGELSPLEEREVKSHLYTCFSCSEEAEKLFVVSEALLDLGALPKETQLVTKRVQKAVRKDGKWYKKKRKKISSLVAASIVFVFFWLFYCRPHTIPFEMDGDNVAFHSRGKNVYVDGSTLSGDLTVIGGNVYVEGPIDGNVTSIDGRILAKVEDASIFRQMYESLKAMWNRIWR